MVEARIFLLDIEIRAHGAGARGIIALELLSHDIGLLGAEPIHQNAHTKIHGCAHAYANYSRQIAKQGGDAPALDQNVALLSESQNFLGRVVKQPSSVDLPSLKQ